MEYLDKKSNLFKAVEPVISGMGFALVDLNSRKKTGGISVYVSIYKPEGITIDDCTLVHRTIFPRIELLDEELDVDLEVSSPGTTRNIKSIDEFFIFTGKKVKILVHDDSEWIHGEIKAAEDGYLVVTTKTGTMNIDYEDIKKAKLE